MWHSTSVSFSSMHYCCSLIDSCMAYCDANSSQYTVHLYSVVLMWYPSFQVSDVIQSETKRFDTTSINYLKRLWDCIVLYTIIINVWDGRMQKLHQISCSKNEKPSENNNSTIFFNYYYFATSSLIIIVIIILSFKKKW